MRDTVKAQGVDIELTRRRRRRHRYSEVTVRVDFGALSVALPICNVNASSEQTSRQRRRPVTAVLRIAIINTILKTPICIAAARITACKGPFKGAFKGPCEGAVN